MSRFASPRELADSETGEDTDSKRDSVHASDSDLSPEIAGLLTSRSGTRVSLALIDRRPLTREFIQCFLEMEAREFSVFPAPSAADLFDVHGKPRVEIHLVVFHIRSAAPSDEWVHKDLELLNQRLPDVPLILLCDRDDIENVIDALACRVRGYITTSLNPLVAIQVLRLVGAGGTYVPASAVADIKKETGTRPQEPRIGHDDEILKSLTSRQLEVLDLLREGKPNKLIAHDLKMQESTVKVHVRTIMKKLNATNRTQLAFIVNQLVDS